MSDLFKLSSLTENYINFLMDTNGMQYAGRASELHYTIRSSAAATKRMEGKGVCVWGCVHSPLFLVALYMTYIDLFLLTIIHFISFIFIQIKHRL